MMAVKGPGCGPCPFPCDGCAVGVLVNALEYSKAIKPAGFSPIRPPLKKGVTNCPGQENKSDIYSPLDLR